MEQRNEQRVRGTAIAFVLVLLYVGVPWALFIGLVLYWSKDAFGDALVVPCGLAFWAGLLGIGALALRQVAGSKRKHQQVDTRSTSSVPLGGCKPAENKGPSSGPTEAAGDR
jgi:hypothetical protein